MSTSLITPVSGDHANSGGTSAASSLTRTIRNDGSVVAGDILIAVGVCERNSAAPSLASTGAALTSVTGPTGGANELMVVGTVTLAAGDLGKVITLSFAGAATRYSALALFYVHGSSGYASAASAKVTNNSSTSSIIVPSITPGSADNLLLGIVGWSTQGVSPYTRTVTPASGWTEQLEEGSTRSAANNGLLYVMSKQLTGGSGSATGTASATESGVQSEYLPMVLAFAPAVAAAPSPVLALNTFWDEIDATGSTPTGSDTSVTFSISPTSNPDSVAVKTDGSGRFFAKRGSTLQTYTVTVTGVPSGLTATATKDVKAAVPAVEVVAYGGSAWA